MPYYDYKNAFSFRKVYLFIRASIRNFFLFTLMFEKFFQGKKSAVIPHYEKFFILYLISSHPRVYIFLFYDES